MCVYMCVSGGGAHGSEALHRPRGPNRPAVLTGGGESGIQLCDESTQVMEGVAGTDLAPRVALLCALYELTRKVRARRHKHSHLHRTHAHVLAGVIASLSVHSSL